MICSKCGTTITDKTNSYCPNCGSPLGQSDPEPNLPPPVAEASKQKAASSSRSSASVKAILAVVIVFLFLLIVCGTFFLYRANTVNAKLDVFETQVSDYKDLAAQYALGSYSKQYNDLLTQCNTCLTDKDTSQIGYLTTRINEVKEKIISENADISNYKAQLLTYKHAANIYVMTGTTKTEYSRLISEFEKAIQTSDTSSCNTLSLQLEQLISRLQTVAEKDAVESSVAIKEYQKQLEELQKELEEKKEDSSNETHIYIEPEEPPAEDSAALYVNPGNDQFICPDSSTRYLTDADLNYLTSQELRIARNEIYARHGRRFSSSDLQAYFDAQSWYNGTISPEHFDDDSLSDIESKNISLIQEYETNYK